MDIIQGIILGIIQGLAEFLPISSSGHLMLFERILGVQESSFSFTILVHIGTLIPVCIAFRDTIWELIRHPFQKTTLLLIIGTLPTVIMAVLFKDLFDAVFGSGRFLGVNFLITALILLLTNSGTVGHRKFKYITIPDAVLVGIMQSFAIAPAISRSGMTICGSLFRGLDREAAARFSFLLSIPAILGGLVLELLDVFKGEAQFFDAGFVPMMAGFVAALISGFFAINVMLRVIRSDKLRVFSLYLTVLGVLILSDQFFFHFFF